jgi:penicillin-insensitive murein endopeptidase
MFRGNVSAAARRALTAVAIGGASLLLAVGFGRAEPRVLLRPVVVAADPAVFIRGPVQSLNAFFPNPDPRVQAVGNPHQPVDDPRTDHHAKLRHATELSRRAPGLEVLGPARRTHFGTYELVELIQQVGANLDARYPGRVMRVGDLSRPRGGTIRDAEGRRIHSSHRNGLDADIMYPHEDCRGSGDVHDGYCDVDVRATLELMQLFVQGGPEDEPSMVDTFYVGSGVRQRTCKYLRSDPVAAERYREVVQRLQPMGGHEAHFHVRIECPDHSLRCPPPRKHRPAFCPRLYRR